MTSDEIRSERDLDWRAMVDVAMRVAFPVLLGIAGWTFTALQDHEKRLTTIEASRYTQAHAQADRQLAQEERQRLATSLNGVALTQVQLVAQISQVKELVVEIKKGARDE